MRTLIILLWSIVVALVLLAVARDVRADVAPQLRGPLTYDQQVYRFIRVERKDGSVVCIRMDVRDFHFDEYGQVHYDGLRIVDDMCEPPRRRNA